MSICKNVEQLTAYTPGEQPTDVAIVKLNTNENPYPPTPRIKALLRSFDYARLRLYPDPVFAQVRARIAALHGCTPEQVFVGNGSDEVLSLCTRAFVEVVDGSIGYFDPSYSLYSVLTDIRGVEHRPVALNDDFTWCEPPADYHASLFFMTNPNAPTSLRYSKDTVRAFAARFTGVLLVDEAYADFADDTCMSLATDPKNTNTLVMRTLSKSYSLAGLRFGYIVGPELLIHALYKIKDSYNMDMLAQAIGLAALGDVAYMRAGVERIRATRQRVTDALRARGWTVCDSQTNFLFARPVDGDAATLFEALRVAKIFVRYFPAPRTREWLRITIGTDEQMDALLRALPR